MIKEENFKNIPNTPGVYIFKGQENIPLYIGKASNLKQRLNYYRLKNKLSIQKQKLLLNATNIKLKPTNSETEALILEASLIKKYQPKYNISLRDDKNYAYVAFIKDKYPKVYITHQYLNKGKEKSRAELIGPFTDMGALKNVLKFLRKSFPYCTCKSTRGHKKPCINTEIGRCLGYCCLEKYDGDVKEMRVKYLKNIRSIKSVLSGRKKSLLRELEKQMYDFSKNKDYKEAATTRNKIQNLEKIFSHSPYIKRDAVTDREKGLRLLKNLINLKDMPYVVEGYDISNIQGNYSVGSMVVFKDGFPEKSEYKRFKIKIVEGINDPAMIYEILNRRLKHKEWKMPHFILIDGGKTQLSAAIRALNSNNQNIKIGALAKKEEELYLKLDNSYKKILLKELPPSLLHLLQSIRNEAHNFAIRFHRKRRLKYLLK